MAGTTRLGRRTRIRSRGSDRVVWRSRCFSRGETISGGASNRVEIRSVVLTMPRFSDREATNTVASDTSRAEQTEHEAFTISSHLQAVRESVAILGKASPGTISESYAGLHSGSRLQGIRDTHSLCTRIRSAKGGDLPQVIRHQEFRAPERTRAPKVLRFVKVTGAGYRGASGV